MTKFLSAALLFPLLGPAPVTPVESQIAIAFPPITSGQRAYDSALLVVNDSEMLSALRGVMLFKVAGQTDAVPVDGSCFHLNFDYLCTVRTEAQVFRLRANSLTRSGTIEPIVGDFADKSVRNAAVGEAIPVSPSHR